MAAEGEVLQGVRIEIVETPRSLRMSFKTHASTAGPIGMHLLGLAGGILFLFLGSTNIAEDGLSREALFQILAAAFSLMAPVVGILWYVLGRTSIELDGSTVWVRRELSGFASSKQFGLRRLNAVRYVEDWEAVKRSGKRSFWTMDLAATSENSPARQGIICDYDGQPKPMALGVPRDVADEVLAVIYARHSELKPVKENV
ncbi:MAG: hypothetical protein GY851_17405 [bacterium]|nr:hypothetical protein [bacterium]